MDNKEPNIWGIHTQNDSLFLTGNKIAIGWRELGNLSKISRKKH